MSQSFIQNCCWITLQVLRHQGWKISVKNWRQNYNTFRGAYRLSRTGIVECLEIIDVGCNLKQFDGLTWLILTPVFHDRSTPLCWRMNVLKDCYRCEHCWIWELSGLWSRNVSILYNFLIDKSASVRSSALRTPPPEKKTRSSADADKPAQRV